MENLTFTDHMKQMDDYFASEDTAEELHEYNDKLYLDLTPQEDEDSNYTGSIKKNKI